MGDELFSVELRNSRKHDQMIKFSLVFASYLAPKSSVARTSCFCFVIPSSICRLELLGRSCSRYCLRTSSKRGRKNFRPRKFSSVRVRSTRALLSHDSVELFRRGSPCSALASVDTAESRRFHIVQKVSSAAASVDQFG